MGNTNQRIEIYYHDKSAFTTLILPNYDLFIEEMRRELEISESVCLTLENNKNEYLASNYKFDSFIQPPINSINIWDQVPADLNEIGIMISTRIFKIIDKRHNKIHALGIKISKDLCLIPRTGVFFHYDLTDLCNEYFIELFNATKGEFDRDGIFVVVGNRVPEQNFILCEISVRCEHLKFELYEEKPLVKGEAVFFNKKVKMLQTKRFTHLRAGTDPYLYLNIESKNWLPGALIISDSHKLLGIHLGNISKECISTHRIFNQISEILEMILYQPEENHLREKLLQINGLKIRLQLLTNIFEDVSQIIIPSLQIRNVITESLNLDK